jgi:hypothetical protein
MRTSDCGFGALATIATSPLFAVLFLVHFSLQLSDPDPLPNNQANQDHCKDGPDDAEDPNVDLVVTHPEEGCQPNQDSYAQIEERVNPSNS